jgi:hypothetical protein
MRLRQNHFTESSILLRNFGKRDTDTSGVESHLLEELEGHERDYWDTNISTTSCKSCDGSGRIIHANDEAEKSGPGSIGWGSGDSSDDSLPVPDLPGDNGGYGLD